MVVGLACEGIQPAQIANEMHEIGNAPVIKITGNPKTYEYMEENIDINGGKVILGKCTLDELGDEIFKKILAVANGEITKAEKLKHREFGIYRIGFTFSAWSE